MIIQWMALSKHGMTRVGTAMMLRRVLPANDQPRIVIAGSLVTSCDGLPAIRWGECSGLTVGTCAIVHRPH
jgi:hypothetical protein